MQYLINFLIAFVIIYLFYLITVVLQKKRYDRFKDSGQVMYFVKKYKVDVQNIDMKKFTNLIGLVNSFIIATAYTVFTSIDSFILSIIVAFIVIILLILLLYHIIGIYLKKEGK